MKLSRLLYGIDITETNIEDLDAEVGRVCGDSRQINENDVFVSIKGNSFDGHVYIGEALKNRAAVIVIENKNYSGSFPYIRVTNSRDAYSRMWDNYCGRPSEDIKLIAVTGTNGKSSTVEMITHILSCNGEHVGCIGTLNSSLTTPDPPELYPRLRDMADKGYGYAVIEASSHALELDKLAPLRFELGIFTNLTPEHLDFHKNMQSYAQSKSKLFGKCRKCIYNYDDRYADMITKSAPLRYSYSFADDSADYVCHNIRTTLEECEFDFLSVGELFHVSIPLTGKFSIYNAVAASAAARQLGVTKEVIKEAFRCVPAIPGRLERVELPDDSFKVFVDYAHTPDALIKVLSTVRECMTSNERLVCVFGCGGDRDKSKRAPMGEIATAMADFTVITSDNSRSENSFDIIRDILSGVDKTKEYLVVPDRRGAIRYAIHTAGQGDVILFCGKGHENYEITAFGKVPFNEKEIIKEAYKERIEKKGNEHHSC